MQKEENNLQHTQVPNEMGHANLDPKDQYIYVIIKSYQNAQTQKCFPSLQEIASKAKTSIPTIRESINDFENWVDYIEECISKLEEYNNKLEEYNNEDEEEVEYEPLETLKGVGVKDTENGIEIMLMGMTSGLLQKYEVIMNIKNYDETDLFNICYEISNEVKNLYYNNNGIPSETQVKEVVRNIMVK